jgi:hypothetical protein
VKGDFLCHRSHNANFHQKLFSGSILPVDRRSFALDRLKRTVEASVRSDIRRIQVYCYRRRENVLLAAHEFGVSIPLDASAVSMPSKTALEAQAKSLLTTEGLASRPTMESVLRSTMGAN